MYFNFSNDNERSLAEELEASSDRTVYYLNEIPLFSSEENKKQLGEFKTVNFFVGSNNSGKSRFLRGLLKSSFLEGIEISSQEEISLMDYKKELDKFYIKKNNAIGIETLVNSYKERFKNSFTYKLLILDDKSYWVEEFEKKLETEVGRVGVKYDEKRQKFHKMITDLFKEMSYIQNNLPEHKVYIPILRSTHKNGNLTAESFEKTIELNYDIKKEQVFTGLGIYNKIYKLNNTKNSKRIELDKFQTFLSKYFFNNKNVKLTADIDDNVILVQVGEDENAIHHVGDGIQALIILLLPVFTAENNTWFFIEEPETHLHPGFQRIFIETILNDEYIKSKNLKFFFTTHSNHFLDLTIDNNDIAIFQFQKINTERFEIKNNVKPSKEILDKLGVQSSSVFLANSSIWVEGPTDRKYLSKFLRLYTENLEVSPLKEDIDFAFFEYGGNLITHYLFDEEIEYSTEEVKEIINSFALSNRICLLADNDNAQGESKKAQRAKVLENLSNKSSNFLYLNTVYKEIENLLPLKIVSGFMEELTKDKAAKVSFERKDYESIGLGEFYKAKFLEKGLKEDNLKAFYSNSGTLKNDYKLKICDYFLQSDIKYLELIEDNKQLENIIKRLYDFIKNKS